MRIVLFLLWLSALHGQGQSVALRGTDFIVTFGPIGPLRSIIGVPYTADVILERAQLFPDGGIIADPPRLRHQARDSQGRTRLDWPIDWYGVAWHPRLTTIVDSATGFFVVIDDQTKIVYRMKVTDAPNTPPKVVPYETKTESLGEQTLEGVVTKGTSFKVLRPGGSQKNDGLIVSVSESWFSEELGQALFTKSTSSRWEETSRLVNLNRAEPAPEVFMPPAGYKIVEKEGAFSITLHRP